MSFYFKSYNNPDYNSFYNSYEKSFFEIDGYSYLLGSIYSKSLLRRLAYISKRDSEGNVIIEKGFDIQNSSQGGSVGSLIHFSNVFKLSNGNFVLTISDENQIAMICLSPDLEQTIWYKKYYDKKDIPLLYNYLSITPDLCLLSNDEVFLSIEEIHSFNGGVNTINYKFLNINIITGTINFSKKYIQSVNYDLLSLRDITSNGSNVILTGEYKNNAFLIIIDRTISIVRKWFFNINNFSATYKSLRGWKISNVYNNKILLLGWHSIGNPTENKSKKINEINDFPSKRYVYNVNNELVDTELIEIDSLEANAAASTWKERYFLLEIDLNGGVSKPGLLISEQLKFSQTFHEIRYEGNSVYFSQWRQLYKISLTTNQNVWGKYIEGTNQVITINLDSIIAFRENFDNYTLAKTNKDFLTCKTIALDTFTIGSFTPQLSNFELSLTSNVLPIYLPQEILHKVNIPLGSQYDICPPPTYYKLKLESHTITPKDFIVNQAISIINHVGTLLISNTGTAATSIPANTLIIATTEGISYKTGNSATSIPVGTTSVPVYVSGTPTQLGSFSPEITISNPFVDNTIDHLKIPFNVIEAPANPSLEVMSDVITTLTAGGEYPHISVTTLKVKNTGNVPYSFSNVKIHSTSNIAGGLIFTASTSTYNGPIPVGEEAIVSIYVDGMATQALSNYSELIVMDLPNVTNPNHYQLRLNVNEEILKIDVLNDLIITEPFPKDIPFIEKSVGFLELQNKTKTRTFTIAEGTVIHEGAGINGITFKTKAEVTLNANQTQSTLVEIVAVSTNGATLLGNSLSYPVSIPLIQSNGHLIIFSVILTQIEAEITSSSLKENTYIKGLVVTPNPDSYESFTVKNNDPNNRSLKIPAGTILFQESQNAFEFKTTLEVNIAAGQQGTVPVTVFANEIPDTLGVFYKTIYIENQFFKISNPKTYQIKLNVIEEPLNAIITDSRKLSTITFIKDYPIPNEISIGFITIENRSQVTDLNLGETIFHEELNINGLVFKTKYNSLADIIVIPHGKSREVEIVVSGEATSLANNFSFPINISDPKIINENNEHQITFNVIEDTLDVEIIRKRFLFPDLKKGQMVNESEKIIGIITLKNKSLVKSFPLPSKTKIHSEPNISGLIIQTANTETITIDAGVTENIEVEIKTPAAPTHFGDFSRMISIKDVNSRYFTIDFDVLGNGTSVDIDDNMSLQSPDFSLQTAGSKGIDSPKGVQLRWMFGGNLGQKHLPKGDADATTNNYNYNKSQDFVNVYRAPYVRAALLLDLLQGPSIVNHLKQCWIYKVNNNALSENDSPARFKVNQRIFHVFFRNKNKYNELRQLIDPHVNPEMFLTAYGENVIEIECKDELFFRVRPIINSKVTGTIYLEMLSAEENKLVTPKTLSFRKIMSPLEMNRTKLFVENGRSIRYKTVGTVLYRFEFEFYNDFIASASYWNSWEDMGKYSLIASSNIKLLNRLLGDINGKWLRYNDGEYVKKQNYIDKWNYSPRPENDFKRGIIQIVERYLDLSINDSTNPRAEEYLDLNFTNPDPSHIPEIPTEDNGGTLISNLDMLNIAAMDYHVARLLGLGMLDLANEVTTGDEYIYLTEYKTLKDPQNENLNKNCQLLSISLPTSTNSERLPFPVEIAELCKGMPKNPNEDVPVLYDDEGYAYDGKSRFVSVINKPLPSAEINPPFFANNKTWDATQYTLPIYAGLEYRIDSPNNTVITGWEKPELSHDDEYFNITSGGVKANLETVPIMLPENFGAPLYVHRQTKSGNYFYSTYGINIFSRAAASNTSQSISTIIKPKNTLLPPSDVRPWLIQPEKPLMFTSEFEQDKYKEITDLDKTFVRISFDYNATQDMITYSIPPDRNITDDDYITDTIKYFPDEYDVFADHVEVYFRDETPKSISARLYKVEPSNDRLCAVFKTKKYDLISTGETLFSELPNGTIIGDFIGSLFVVNGKSYVIKGIENSSEGLIFTVYKEEVSQTILSGGNISVNFNSLTTPVTSGNDLFAVIENMQSEPVWKVKNPDRFKKVHLEFPEIKREVITTISESGSVQKYLEKSRGFWPTAKIEPHLEIKDTTAEIPELIHKGIYKITSTDLGLGIPFDETELGFYEKNNGFVRIFRTESISGNLYRKSRDVFKVIRTETIGRYVNLYIYDSEFNETGNAPENEIQTGSGISINYYPSYFLYLYKNVENNLTEDTVLPKGNQISKQTIFGLRTVDTDNQDIYLKDYKSKFSVPSLMVGVKIISPQQPEQPKGSLYATRPDFYGKSTYSFTTKFFQKPYSVQFCRTDNNALLSAIYEQKTIDEIFEDLSKLGGNDEEFLANRWTNFFDFDYYRGLKETDEGMYESYPKIRDKDNSESFTASKTEISSVDETRKEDNESNPVEQLPLPTQKSYAFPLPNKVAFFEGINKFIEMYKENTGQSVAVIPDTEYGNIYLNAVIIPEVTGVNEEMRLIDFIEETLDYTFVPLTEIPIIYQHVKKFQNPDPKKAYLPLNKKQKIRDENGYLLKPEDGDFDMAPMMTILNENENTTLFTDFTLNGTTNGLYFYASKEIGSQMKMSALSKVLGPVKLVNSNPAEAPKILSGLPVLENKTLGITSKIKIEIQPYPAVQKISRINLYRAHNRLDAESILSMELVKQVNVSDLEINEDGIWKTYDELEDFNQIPYGDTLYYRVTVEKEIQYADPELNLDDTTNIIIDYAPSQASKIMALMLTETQNPDSPNIIGSGTRPIDSDSVNNIILEWNQTCYKGIYHLYALSPQGNWKEIARLIVNDKNNQAQLQILDLSESEWTNVEIIDINEGKFLLPLNLLGQNFGEQPLFDHNNNRIYHHFKVIAENTSNMFSTQENILTLFSDDVWSDLQGISLDGINDGMIIEKTFIIK